MQSAHPNRFAWWTLFAGIAAVAGNIAACIPWLYSVLFLMQPHSHGRLIVEAFFAGIASLVALVVTFPLACLAFFGDRRRLLGVIFMCMAFTPFPLAVVTLHTVAALRHITLDE
jgi:hypothetical protein